MTPSMIRSGDRYGNWEVIKFDHNNKHRIKYFLCKCLVCGAIRPVRGTALIDGTSTACSKECSHSLLGQKFGEWIVLARDNSRVNYYWCRCSCGTERSVHGSTLKNGMSKSCGCLKDQHNKEKNRQNAEAKIGQKFGLLTIEDVELRGQDYYYYCKCDCGKARWYLGKRLFRGEAISCGCVHSKANEEMDKILTRYNIPFVREYRFEDCKDKGTLPFDFALFNKYNELIGLIENNGEQHYSSRGTGWYTPERLQQIQKHGYIKQKFCEDNKIPFLVIPYQYFDELEKFLITSDFWKIIIRNFND